MLHLIIPIFIAIYIAAICKSRKKKPLVQNQQETGMLQDENIQRKTQKIIKDK